MKKKKKMKKKNEKNEKKYVNWQEIANSLTTVYLVFS
jgi:hypothetical protein